MIQAMYGAISGAIAEAYYGTPHQFVPEVRARLSSDLNAILDKLEELNKQEERGN